MLLYGKPVVESIISRLGKVAGLNLAIVQVGNNPESSIYVNKKIKMAESIGASVRHILLPQGCAQDELLRVVTGLGSDSSVNGVIVQFPLPPQMDTDAITHAINPLKDVDGFHPDNVGRLFSGRPRFIPATPKGILHLLKHYQIPISGKNAVIIGRSNLVGKPLSALLLNENATVTICHSKTKNLSEHTLRADILVSATGSPNLVTADMVKDGAAVIDVGINRVDGKVMGDCDFEGISKKASISPVPGGVGPITVATLMENLVYAAKLRG